MTIPLELYRFHTLDDKRLDTIERHSIWLSSPHVFVDLADCRLELIIDAGNDLISDEIIKAAGKLSPMSPLGKTITENLIELLNEKKKGERNIIDLLEGKPGKTLADLLKQSWLIQELRDRITDTTAVCCFVAGDPLNPLMWAHYADGHRGFCIEYKVDLDAKGARDQLFAVNYMTERAQVSPEELLINPTLAIKRVTASKDNVWAYEREYRIVIPNALRGGNQGLGKEIPRPDWLKPTAVIGGARTQDEDSSKKLAKLASSLGVVHRRIESVTGKLRLSDPLSSE